MRWLILVAMLGCDSEVAFEVPEEPPPHEDFFESPPVADAGPDAE